MTVSFHDDGHRERFRAAAGKYRSIPGDREREAMAYVLTSSPELWLACYEGEMYEFTNARPRQPRGYLPRHARLLWQFGASLFGGGPCPLADLIGTLDDDKIPIVTEAIRVRAFGIRGLGGM